jgi:aspartate racemase
VRVIGLLGGMSWVSTAHYYRLINADVAARLGTEHSAALTLWQGDFAAITDLQRTERWDDAGVILAEGAKALVAAGADLVAICANTMHLCSRHVADAIAPRSLVDIVEVVRDECLVLGITRLGLLGTAYTMESPVLYPPVLAVAGIEVIVPDAAERAQVQRITFEELIADVVTERSRRAFHDVATSMIERGADGVALACTEHGLMLSEGDLPVPVLDTTVLHARRIVDQALR